MRAAILIRKSKGESWGGSPVGKKSPEEQTEVMQAVCLAFLAREGYECDPGTDIYTDVGETGGLVLDAAGHLELPTERPAVRRLLSRIGRYQAVCLYKFDRLGLDQLLIGLLPYTFLSAGVKVLSPIDGEIDPTSAESKFIFNMKGYLSEAERNAIRDRTHHAIRGMRAEGKLVGNGVCRYGYRYERLGPGRRAGRRRVVDPVAAGIIVRIFETLAAGVGIKALCRGLTLEGIPTPRKGKSWSPWTVADIIQDPSYKGAPYQTDKYKHLGVKVRSPSEKSYWARDKGSPRPLGEPTPAIVDEALWDRANEALAAKKFTRAPSREYQHWLRGRVRCLACQLNMDFQERRGVWLASCRGCHLRARLEDIDTTTWDLALRVVRDPGILRRSLLAASEGLNPGVMEATLAGLARREQELRSKVANLADLVENATNRAARDAYEARIDQRSAEIEAIVAQAQAVRSDLDRKRKLCEEAEAIVEKVRVSAVQIQQADHATQARFAILIGLAVAIQREPPRKLIWASCTPKGIEGKPADDQDVTMLFKYVESGKGRYNRKK